MRVLFEAIYGRRIRRETAGYLGDIAQKQVLASRQTLNQLLERFRLSPEPKVVLGTTPWGENVEIPLASILRTFMVTGASGAGKTRAGLAILKSIIPEGPNGRVGTVAAPQGVGTVDAKLDFFYGALFLLAKRLEFLQRNDPAAADALRQRVVIIDFASPDPISSYNILARWPNTDPDFFAATRADLLMDLLPGSDSLSPGAGTVLRKVILLLSEFNLPITKLDAIVSNDHLRAKLLAQSRNPRLVSYFARQFAQVPKSTIAAIVRRIEALFASESVRLVLDGTSAPDFRRLQDESKLVFISCFGTTIARSVRRLLHALVLSDITHAVFGRTNRDIPYLWLCDEAQHCFLTENLRDKIVDLATMARSFSSSFGFFTQDASTAVQDPRILKVLHTNIGWTLSLRGDPSSCVFLKPFLPVTGQRLRPKEHGFAEPSFYSLAEERALMLEEMANLPNRFAYLWLKGQTAEAIPLWLAEVAVPDGTALEVATAAIRQNATIGMRVSRKRYDELIAERDRQWLEDTVRFGTVLKQAYRKARGGITE